MGSGRGSTFREVELNAAEQPEFYLRAGWLAQHSATNTTRRSPVHLKRVMRLVTLGLRQKIRRPSRGWTRRTTVKSPKRSTRRKSLCLLSRRIRSIWLPSATTMSGPTAKLSGWC